MGALTFAQMQTLVKRTVNNRDDLNTEIAQAINNAYLQASMIRGVSLKELDGYPKLFSLVAGVMWYDFETYIPTLGKRGILAIYSMKDMTTANSRRLKPVSVQFIEDLGSTSGVPRYFAHYGPGVMIGPSPDIAYSMNIRYRLRPTLLSASGDVTVIQDEFDWVIVWGAASDINASIGVLDKSSFYSTKRREAIELITTTAEIEDEYADMSLAPDLS